MKPIEQVATLATFGSVWAVFAVGHNLTDHVIGQTDHQANGKAAPSAAEVADGASPRGWAACLGHCLSVGLLEERAVGPLTDVVVSASALGRCGVRHVVWTAAA
ncbi:hypothetical protein ACWDYJ_19435 [Streptomyces sp. NPDC003042]